MGRVDQRLAGLLLASLVGWSAYLAWQPNRHVQGDLSRGFYSDHYSHLNAFRAFVFGRVNLWTTPLSVALRPLTPGQREALPEALQPIVGARGAEVYALPGSAADKPVIASWSRRPRPYPPGDLVAVLPVALLYEWTGLSFTGACVGLIWLFLLYAHVAVFFFARALRGAHPVALVALALLYLEGVHWALEGFYDTAALVPLGVAALAMSERRWLVALVAWSAAAFFHFRVFFLAPYALLFAGHFLASGAWRRLARGASLQLGAAIVLGGLALVAFVTVSATLQDVRVENPIAWTATPNPRLSSLLLGAALCGAALAWAGAWFDVLVGAWMLLLAVNLRQAFFWHPLLLAPWLLFRRPVPRAGRMPVVDMAKLVFFVLLARLGFGNELVPAWLTQLW